MRTSDTGFLLRAAGAEKTGFVSGAVRRMSFIHGAAASFPLSGKAAYNPLTGEVTQRTEEKLPDGYVKKMKEKINRMFLYSAKIIENDYFRYVVPAVEEA